MFKSKQNSLHFGRKEQINWTKISRLSISFTFDPSYHTYKPINRTKKEKEKKKKRGAETGLSPSKISSGVPIGDRLPFHGPVSVPAFE